MPPGQVRVYKIQIHELLKGGAAARRLDEAETWVHCPLGHVSPAGQCITEQLSSSFNTDTSHRSMDINYENIWIYKYVRNVNRIFTESHFQTKSINIWSREYVQHSLSVLNI